MKKRVGSGRGQLSEMTYSRRNHLVITGRASWLNWYLPLDRAIEKAGL